MNVLAFATTEDIKQARQMDLLTYLQYYEPSELVKVSNGTYCTREHDSLKISNGKWYWFSRSIGGSTALDYLTHVKGYSLPEAVEAVLRRPIKDLQQVRSKQKQTDKALLLPEKSESNAAVTKYLRRRGIHPALIDYCYRKGLLFEGLPYHNAVFVGYDNAGDARYAALRATEGQYKGEATGSDKQYSFRILANRETTTVHLFESAIDLLSYATMEYRAGRNWQRDHLLSLAGVFSSKRWAVIPVALSRFLEDQPLTKTLCLHLDNDAAGREATEGIIAGLQGRYEVIDEPPEYGKDVNDTLRQYLLKKQSKEEYAR